MVGPRRDRRGWDNGIRAVVTLKSDAGNMVVSLLRACQSMGYPKRAPRVAPDVPRTSLAAGAGSTARAFSERSVSPIVAGRLSAPASHLLIHSRRRRMPSRREISDKTRPASGNQSGNGNGLRGQRL